MVLRGLTGPYTIRDDHVELPGGGVAVVIGANGLDLDAVDPARRRSALGAFANLCHSLDTPLQIVIRSRPVVDRDVVGERAPLDAAMQRHRASRMLTAAPHRPETFLVLTTTAGCDAAAAVKRVLETLRSMGLTAHRLPADELQAAAGATLDVPWIEASRLVRIGDTVAAGMALRRLPGAAVAAGWMRPLLSIPAACDIAIHLRPAHLGSALRTLAGRLRDFSAHRLLEAERGGLADVHVDIALDAAFSLRGRLARHHGRPLHLSLTAVVHAATPAALAADLGVLRTAFHSSLAVAEPLHFRHAAACLTVLPLGVDAVGLTKLVDSTAAATCVPWFEASCDEPGGYRLGEVRGSDAPVAIAPFDTARHQNANIAVLAASGHGKSFALGALLLEASLQGVDAVVVDPEGEYEQVAHTVGGSSTPFAPGTDAALNIFDCRTGDDGGAAAAAELIAVMCDRLGDEEHAAVDAAVQRAIAVAAAAHRVPVLGDCLAALPATSRLAAVVGRHCGGALGMLFNRPTTMRFARGITAISLRDMPSEHVPAATLLLARCIWSMLLRDPRRRHIVFDEAGALCAHPALRSLLLQLARRCRKHGASLVVATQNAQDLLATDEGTVVVTNCATVLLGGQRPADVARMEHAFGLTAGQRRFLESAARGEFLLIAGSRRLEMRVDVPPEYAGILARDSAGRPDYTR